MSLSVVAATDYPIQAAKMTDVKVTRGFWFDRIETNRLSTLKTCFATFTDDTITIGDKTYPALKASNGLKLIPYCLLDNREPGNEMQCWFREK